jgi:hypothetical protein
MKCFRRAIDKGDDTGALITLDVSFRQLSARWDVWVLRCFSVFRFCNFVCIDCAEKEVCIAVGYGNYMICNYLCLCVNWIEVNAWWTASVSAFTECAVCKPGEIILKFFATVSYIFALRFWSKLNIENSI